MTETPCQRDGHRYGHRSNQKIKPDHNGRFEYRLPCTACNDVVRIEVWELHRNALALTDVRYLHREEATP